MDYKKLYTVISAIALMSIVILSGCQDEKTPDISEVRVELQTQRMDRDFAAIDTNNMAASLKDLQRTYPEFLNFYLDTLMGFGIDGNYTDTSSGIQKGLRTFLTYPDFRGLFDTISKHYPNTKDVDGQLAKGFQYLKHYYPGYSIPKIIYLNSNLNNYAAFTYDTTIIGIGLDMYLGESYPFYKSVGLPNYVVMRCTKAYIPANVFQAIYRAKHPFEAGDNSLLDMMIQRGKEQYFLSKVIPFVDESIRLGYTKEQLQWAEASEASVYNFFIDKQFLYSTNIQQILRYVSEGPTSAGMPQESPGNIGTWIGYRIVKAYAETHSDVDLEQIIALKDPQKILQQSKYKPK